MEIKGQLMQKKPVNPFTTGTRRVGIDRRISENIMEKGIFQFNALKYPLITVCFILLHVLGFHDTLIQRTIFTGCHAFLRYTDSFICK